MSHPNIRDVSYDIIGAETRDLQATVFLKEYEVTSRRNRERLGEFRVGDSRCVVCMNQDVWTDKTAFRADEDTSSGLHKTGKNFIYGTDK